MSDKDECMLDERSFKGEEFTTPFDGEPVEVERSQPSGVCYACDEVGVLDSLGLCQSCSSKLERDLIRKRDWEYSMTAFALDDKQGEDLRTKVIKQYGKKLKFITK